MSKKPNCPKCELSCNVSHHCLPYSEPDCVLTVDLDEEHCSTYRHDHRDEQDRLARLWGPRGHKGACPNHSAKQPCALVDSDKEHAFTFSHDAKPKAQRTDSRGSRGDSKRDRSSSDTKEDGSALAATHCMSEKCDGDCDKLHFCLDALACSKQQDASHCSKFYHPRVCDDQEACVKSDSDRTHIWLFTHPCRYQEKCRFFKNDVALHCARFVHPCPDGAGCAKQEDIAHRCTVSHPCKFQAKCKHKDNVVHLSRFVHGTLVFAESKRATADGIASPLSSTSSSSSPAGKQTPKGVCSKDAKCEHQYERGAGRCKLRHPSSALEDVTSEKAKLKNPLKDFFLGAEQPVTVNGTAGVLLGLEVSGKIRLTGNVLFGVPDASAELGFRVQSVSKASVTNTGKSINAPWHHPDCLVFRTDLTTPLRALLKRKCPGVEAKYSEIFDRIRSKGFGVFIMGGAVRDCLQGITVFKDIDMGFGCAAEQMKQITSEAFWRIEVTGTGLTQLGNSSMPLYLEGKALNGYNNDAHQYDSKLGTSSISNNLHAENIYGDFCCNRLWYCPENDAIFDPTGFGVGDAIFKLLRIPCPRAQWDMWARGNPSKLLRYWKMKARGYTVVDAPTHQFLVDTAKQFLSNGLLSSWLAPFAGRLGKDKDAVRAAMAKDLGSAPF